MSWGGVALASVVAALVAGLWSLSRQDGPGIAGCREVYANPRERRRATQGAGHKRLGSADQLDATARDSA